MPDKKLTDNEIVKALESMINFADMVDKNVLDMVDVKTLKNILDLINRLQARVEKCEKVECFADKTIATLQAENERLRNAYKQCAWERDNFQADNERLYGILENKGGLILTKTAKAEAYKEFAEKAKAEIEEALKNNYKVKKERTEKYINSNGYDEFMNYCNGKIDCLRGLDDFLDNLLKELVGDSGETVL